MPARDDAFVDGVDDVERFGRVAGHDLQDVVEAPLLVAGIDALGRVADVEVGLPFQAGRLLEDGDADVLGDAGIDGRFVDDDVALLQRLAPMVDEACRSGSRLGCLLASIGVGTVTMWKSASRKSRAALVNVSVFPPRSALGTSPVRSYPFDSSLMRRALVSNPVTDRPDRPKATAAGSPT